MGTENLDKPLHLKTKHSWEKEIGARGVGIVAASDRRMGSSKIADSLKNVPQAADYFFAATAGLRNFRTKARRMILPYRRKKKEAFL